MPNSDDGQDKLQRREPQRAPDKEAKETKGVQQTGNAAGVTSRRPGDDGTEPGNGTAAEATRTITADGTGGRNSGKTAELNRHRASKSL
jgi:hypothetical protein